MSYTSDLFGNVDQKTHQKSERECFALKKKVSNMTQKMDEYVNMIDLLATECDWYRSNYGNIYLYLYDPSQAWPESNNQVHTPVFWYLISCFMVSKQCLRNSHE